MRPKIAFGRAVSVRTTWMSAILSIVGLLATADRALSRPVNDDSIACSAETEMRRVDSPSGEYSAQWCQYERHGQVARHGPYVEIFSDGELLRRGSYLRGLQAGTWTRWNRDGSVVSERVILPGESGPNLLQPEDLCPPGTYRERYRSFSDLGRLESDCTLRTETGDVRHGPSVDWEETRTDSGIRYALRELTDYQFGQREGRHLVFEGPSGAEKLIVEQSYEADALHGPSRTFFSNGVLRESRQFEQGQFRGVRVAFFEDGTERWRLAYDTAGPTRVSGDFTIAGEPCPGRTVPIPSADASSLACMTSWSSSPVRDGPYEIRDRDGRVVEQGRFRHGSKVEIWQSTTGAEIPAPVSDQHLVAVARLLFDQLPVRISQTAPKELDQGSSQWDSIDGLDSEQSVVAEPSTEATPLVDVWFQNNDTGKHLSVRTEIEDGEIRIFGLSPARYYMQVRVDRVAENPQLFPGDLMASAEFVVLEGEVRHFDVELLATMRLLSPWDNSEFIPGMERRCVEFESIPSPVLVAWRPPVEDLRGVEYSYTVWKKSCEPHGPNHKVLNGTTAETSFEVELPDSGQDFYQLYLSAEREGRKLGHLMTFGSDGSYGWNLNFRVAPRRVDERTGKAGCF